MSPLDPRTYCPISHASFEAMRAELLENGVTILDQNDGEAPGPHGLHFKWHYEPESASGSGWLRVQIDGTQWIVERAWAAVESHILKFVGR